MMIVISSLHIYVLVLSAVILGCRLLYNISRPFYNELQSKTFITSKKEPPAIHSETIQKQDYVITSITSEPVSLIAGLTLSRIEI
jgi:hypothetical protein